MKRCPSCNSNKYIETREKDGITRYCYKCGYKNKQEYIGTFK